MPTLITKKSTVPGKVPLSTDLQIGELAVNTADKKLYSKHNDGNVVEIGGSSSGTFQKGTAIIDFGNWPGQHEAEVSVTGQGAITTDSSIFVTVNSDNTSSDHTAQDHTWFLQLASLSVNSISAGVGFNIKAVSLHKMQGTFTVNWQWK